MIVYYFVIIASVLISLFAMNQLQKYKEYIELGKERMEIPFYKWSIIALIAMFTFVSAFRYFVGSDYINYYMYSHIERWIYKLKVNPFDEPGNGIILIICKLIGGRRNGLYIIASSSITIPLIIWAIGRDSVNLLLSILLFIFSGVFIGSFNGVRQYLAMSICFWGIKYIFKQDLIKWIIVVILAASFHVTAIMLMPIYYLNKTKINWKIWLILGLAGIGLYFSYSKIYIVLSFLKNEEMVMTSYHTRSVKIFRVLVQCVPVMLIFLIGIKKINADTQCCFLSQIMIFNALISIIAMKSTYLSRFTIYTSVYQILFFPMMQKKMTSHDSQMLQCILIFMYFIYWYIETSKSPTTSNFHWIFKYWF